MITQIKSQKVKLPPIYLVETKEDFNELPKGLPYIVGTSKDLPFIRLYLEFQVLFKSAKKTGLPINWLKALVRIGYDVKRIKKYDLRSGGNFWESSTGNSVIPVEEFIEDQYIVNFDRLADLKVLPKWLDDLRASVEVNIVDEVTFDPTAFNKQLGLNVGSGTIKHNLKNLLILDVSGSIPRAVVKTTVALAKLMSKKFFADIMITSGQTVLIDYDSVPETDIEAQAIKSGTGNEGRMYADIIKQNKIYNTVIAFGDNDNPQYYINQYNIPCNFKIETLYSLHTDRRSDEIVGYARAFNPTTVHKVKDWLETVEN